MNNDTIKSAGGGAAGAVVLFFVLLFVYTKFVGAIPLSISSVVTQKSDTFNVSATGETTAIPDAASVSIGVEEQGGTVSQAQDALNAKINAIVDAVKSQGIADEDIQTTNYSINPIYDYESRTQQITGYRAGSNVRVKTTDTQKINSVIDAATGVGANTVSGVSFEVSEPEEALAEARREAVQKAREKANDVASTAGFRLGRLVNYSESQGGGPVPMMFDARAEGLGAGGEPTNVQPGSSDISVTVTLSFEIE